MNTNAIVLESPGRLALQQVALVAPGPDDVVVETQWTAVSAGTERLLWEGRMPDFPGMGYPLVPGYESAGCIVDAGVNARHRIGETVFVPGARCYENVRALFGGAAARLVTNEKRAARVPDALGADSTLLALAATALRAVTRNSSKLPELVIGHGVLGRLIARIIVASGGEPPLVWEMNAARRDGADGYAVSAPTSSADPTKFHTVIDASGDPDVIDTAVSRLSARGEVVLAGFYKERMGFVFAPAFMREATIRISAEFDHADLEAVLALISSGRLSLGGLITHREPAGEAGEAYRQAFEDPSCLKMVLDWRNMA